MCARSPAIFRAAKKAADDNKAAGITNVAVIGVYATIDTVYRQEDTVRDILQSALGPTVNITISRDVAGLGFIERENASVLNATILPLAQLTIRQFQKSLTSLGISDSLWQSDQLINSDDTAKLPISMFLSGPTNSVTGTVFLADRKSLASHGALVLDIGGTTSDVCCVEPAGLPRPAAAFAYHAGIRTNFTIPDLQSIGIGGGSIIRLGGDSVTVGPDSVGKDIAVKERSFGGNFLTTTDIMVAAGQENIGNRVLLSDISIADIESVQMQIKSHLEQVIDGMKLSEQDVTLILVGDGSIICPLALNGISDIKRPPYSQVANAVGAAMA
ncbi:hydantoinase [Ophiostoma piceae UAMH 11346]|uniref:Hydantoinase n=1 Tax=Ophiostoma piceae (strain UAMH 11346) TaxID=1262450 RepID=S3C8C5_OPHP1|nr:hydantoinase [Ophiostoma piceae UAMH 11346]